MIELYPNKKVIYYSTDDYDYLNENMTYLELSDKVNKLASYMITNYGIKLGDIIGVKMRRGKNFVIVILAILKIGACYVPIDATYPDDRINYMIEDCKPKLLIQNTNANNTDRSTIVVTFEEIYQLAQNVELVELINFEEYYKLNKIVPDTIAYIIYTSGSTGKPKGCSIKHQSITNVLCYFKDLLNINQNDKVWSLTTISFDIMVLEVFLPLVCGCELLLCPQCVTEDPINLVQWINKHSPTVLQATPTQFNLIADHININQNMSILVGGEAITEKLAEKLLRITNNVYNVYGPSETTIWSTTNKITDPKNISIGKPIYNTQCVILNEINQCVPIGSVGELCIGGDGLSIGYLNRPDITLKKFIKINDKTFYKTGDLAKINYSFDIEYIGRTDFQVKINGRRIELGEIINTMELHNSINKAVVISKTKNDVSYLIAYYTGTNDVGIFDYLRNKLPIWMVPNLIIHVQRFKETLNGKIDINALPDPFDENSNLEMSHLRSNEIIEPQTNTEMIIHQIYLEVIKNIYPINNIKNISTKESIVYFGATSLTIMQLVSKLNKEFNIAIKFEDYYKISTIESCAKLIDAICYK